jgi:MalT-like TPR region
LSRASLLLGRLDEAQRLGYRSIQSSARHPGFAAHALHLFGDIMTHPDRFDVESGKANYREALLLARRHGMRPLIAHCHLGLGKMHARIGDLEHAEKNLTEATAMYAEMGMNFWLEQSQRLADAVLANRGSSPESNA